MPSLFINVSRLETPLSDRDSEEPHTAVTSAAAVERSLCRARGRAQETRNPDPAMGELPRPPGVHCGKLPSVPRVTPAIRNPYTCTTQSFPRGLPAVLLSVGLKIIKQNTCPLPDQEKLNDTETSLPWGHLMLALTVLLH